MSEYSDVFWQMGTRCPFSVYGHCGFKFPHHTSVWKVWEPTLVQYSAGSSGEICTFSRGKWKQSSSVKTLHIHHSVQWSSKGNKKKNTFFTERGLKNNPKCYSVPESYTLEILMPKKYGHSCCCFFPQHVLWLAIQPCKGHTATDAFVPPSPCPGLCAFQSFNFLFYFAPPCRERGVQAGDSTAVWGFRGNHRWSGGRRCCQDPAGPAPPQTHLLSTAGREGEREGGRRHGPGRPRGQRRWRGQGPERSQWVWQDTDVEMLRVWIAVLPTNTEGHGQK